MTRPPRKTICAASSGLSGWSLNTVLIYRSLISSENIFLGALRTRANGNHGVMTSLVKYLLKTKFASKKRKSRTHRRTYHQRYAWNSLAARATKSARAQRITYSVSVSPVYLVGRWRVCVTWKMIAWINLCRRLSGVGMTDV